MSMLDRALRARRRHHIALPDAAVPVGRPDLFVWAANGLFKRGTTAEVDILLQLAATAPTHGLVTLATFVWWRAYRRARLPATLLNEVLAAARLACVTEDGGNRPMEWQGYLAARAGAAALLAPPPLEATAVRVTTVLPDEPVLVDVHSHHRATACFSATDDADDGGVSVSAVVGRIDARPTLLCRLNVYGAHQLVPASLLFDGLGPFRDGFTSGVARLEPGAMTTDALLTALVCSAVAACPGVHAAVRSRDGGSAPTALDDDLEAAPCAP